MTAPKLTPEQATLALRLTKQHGVSLDGPIDLGLRELNIAQYTGMYQIQLATGVTRVQHPSGTVWLNTEGEVLAVE